ncbi:MULTISPECIES: TRAP transporter small permease [Sulfitobacter]|jgi:TRAP-type C4-dicarboxylate transport system permease small subunit|uniref:TRAP transporter small permease n=1 Tax=Sulfitobacter TaxID=60136 RepID=UPI000E9406A7|nr:MULTISPECIES: TRAP transporter small permease [Sulfitobacter]HAR80843.1 C4-dicarboxylate ABC transporter permease [Sulfitobacter pontiacus]HBR42755.1 C4-dicarboxylate ABC transporter permease [Sulfitobacter pontiacus]|tara:strand:- start:5039 stop:5620 length:582 start_codon:yes stop_codon:yes gene_type:complete
MRRLIYFLARFTAVIGGLVLMALVLMTTASIIGRTVNKMLHSPFFQEKLTGLSQGLIDMGIGEINGNYELLEAGVAFAIFSFLPICQYYGAHATVDVFTSFLPARVNRWIMAFWEVVLAAVIMLIIWRLYEGMQRYLGNGETTLFLQFPVWWAYAASFASGVIASVVSVYCAVIRVIEAIRGTDILPSEQGAH